AQLWLEEKIGLNPLAGNARRDLISFFRHLKIPVNLDELGLGKATINELRQVCCFAVQPNSDLHYLPFIVTEDDLLMSLTCTDYY
ncbi:MAG TPA: oxidoreductase, partial [Prochlorococcaceae cyanobacterium AMR_MDS_5431]|nr:oxidoreductase [Prochlorococcaceae cyanobacterium AMR_MDS_5431]